MSTKTEHLQLTLPANGEYLETWDQPNNNNFELIDDNAKAVKEDLVGTGGATGDLGGSVGNLLSRLAIGINTDGTLKSSQIDLGANSDYYALRNSKVYAVSSGSTNVLKIRQRLDQAELELAKLRQGLDTNRYGTATFPEALTGMAMFGDYYSGQHTNALTALHRGFTPNCVVDGPATFTPYVPTHLTYSGTYLILNGSSSVPVIYNIDGYPFKVSEQIYLDVGSSGYNLLSNTFYVYASRNEGDFGNSHVYQYKTAFTATRQIDIRTIPAHSDQRAASPANPSDGVVVADTATFTSAGSLFQSYGVAAGDILAIEGAATSGLVGEYVVKSVASETELTMFSTFTEAGTSIGFYVKRPTMPTVEFSTTLSQVAGRICIGKIVVDGTGTITSVTPFAYNGIYDTGWINCNAFTYSTANHYLGVTPSSFELLLRKGATEEIYYNPKIRVYAESIDDQVGGPFAVGDIWVDGVSLSALPDTFTVTNLDILGTGAMFYADGTFIDNTATAYQLRAILRR